MGIDQTVLLVDHFIFMCKQTNGKVELFEEGFVNQFRQYNRIKCVNEPAHYDYLINYINQQLEMAKGYNDQWEYKQHLLHFLYELDQELKKWK